LIWIAGRTTVVAITQSCFKAGVAVPGSWGFLAFSAGRTGRILQSMADPAPPVPYEVKTRRCTIHAGRYRWDIWAHGKRAQSSTDSFATREEATAAGHAELEKLGKTLRTDE
jgi:hypothetical protein